MPSAHVANRTDRVVRLFVGRRRLQVGRQPVGVDLLRYSAVLVMLLGMLAVAGCGASSGGPSATTGPPPRPAASPSSAPAPSGGGSAAPEPNAPEINPAGDIPDSQVFVPFAPPRAGFAVAVPQGWARSDSGAATVFTDKFNSVRIESRPLAAAPDPASVRTQDVPALQAAAPGFVLGEVSTVSRPAGPAVLVTYMASSAPNAVTGKSVTEAVERYAFWRAGTELVVTLSGPKGADNVDPWRKVTDSLRWRA